MTTISTSRLVLRPLTKATAQSVGWLRDPEVVKFSQQRHQEHNYSSQLRYVNSFGGGSRIWSIHRVEENDHIGNLSATHDEPNNVCDVGIMIGETRAWGKGYGAEAWQGACNWLLDKDCGGIRKLEAGCARTNEAMVKIIRRSRFTEEGERLNHFLFDGSPVSMLLFGRPA